MKIRIEKTVTFDIPREGKKALEFEKQNPDWFKDDTTSTHVIFTKSRYYLTTQEEEANELIR